MWCTETQRKAEWLVFWGPINKIERLLSGISCQVNGIFPYGFVKKSAMVGKPAIPVVVIKNIEKVTCRRIVYTEFSEKSGIIPCISDQCRVRFLHIFVTQVSGLKGVFMGTFV